MKRLLLIAIAFLPFLKSSAQSDYERQIELFASDLAKKIPSGNNKVAIIDFRNNDEQITQFTKQFADDLSVELAMISGVNKFQVVERHKMSALLNDMKMSDRRSESKIMLELAKKSVAKIFLSGTITTFGDNYRVTVKILDDEGDLISASKGLIVKTAALETLHKKILEDFGKGIPFTNDLTVENIETSSKKAAEPAPVKVYNPQPSQPTSQGKGWIEFTNSTNNKLNVWTSQDPAVHKMEAKTFEETTVASGDKITLPALNVGVYYICAATTNGILTVCEYSRKVEVKNNQGAEVIFK